MFNIKYDEIHLCNVLFVSEDKFNNKLNSLKDLNLFKGSNNEMYLDLNMSNQGSIYLGLNDLNKLDDLRLMGFNLGKTINSRKIVKVSINLENLNDDLALGAFLEGLMNSHYHFDYYKNKKNDFSLVEVSLNNLKNKEVVTETFNLVNGVFTARDLVNLAPIDLYPKSYADKVFELFKDTKVLVEVYNKEEIKKLKMESLLAVANGSINEPYFVVLKYFNDPSTSKHKTIIGKGVTYDSGGYAIKPAASMVDMKNDMAGSAAMVGVLKALNDNNVKTNVVGVMALAENMISDRAYKNGDVISSMKGTKVEIINTDAEGRLTLADAIYYAATKLESTHLYSIATLTGAAAAAFGRHITPFISTNKDLTNQALSSSLRTGDKTWEMPITNELEDMVKSNLADLVNAVRGGAGMMTAGIFLKHFSEGLPYIHFDIAGTAFGGKYKYLPEGATGVGVKTLYELVK